MNSLEQINHIMVEHRDATLASVISSRIDFVICGMDVDAPRESEYCFPTLIRYLRSLGRGQSE